MKILNYRKSFACNSSSAHTTIITKNPDRFYDALYDEFGWENFVAESTEAKELYIRSQIMHYYLPWDINNDSDEFKKNEQRGKKLLKKLGFKKFDYLDVDHQSIWLLPYDQDNPNELHFGFLKALIKYVLNKKCVILGGNDNDGESEFNELTDKSRNVIQNNLMDSYEKFVCKQENDIFILFNNNNGTKMRISFNDDNALSEKADSPELIDFNIIDKCREKCPFCYRSCDPHKGYVPIEKIKQYLDYFEKIKCFEVVFGGGDILLHPDLNKFESEFSKYNISFTTTININSFKRMFLLQESKLFKSLSLFKKIAISCFTLDDVKYIYDILSKGNKAFTSSSVIIQIIPEFIIEENGFETLQKIIDYIADKYLGVSFVGYKQTGRASNKKLAKYQDELESILTDSSFMDGVSELSFDTKLVHDYKSMLEGLHCLKLSYYVEEGKFSCFVNGMDDTVASGSYTNDIHKLENMDDILKYFKTF